MRGTRTSQRGVALITVMLVVALATIAAVAMASRQQIDIRRTENTLNAGQAYHFALGAERWALQILTRDRRQGEIDHLGEDWAQELPPLPIEGGSIEGRIVDLQGLFNLNSLLAEGEAGRLAQERFQRLLVALEIQPELMQAVLDWIDPDLEPRFPGGAEDTYYLGLTPAYRAANQPMASPSELRQVQGVTPAVYERLAPYITALPTATSINVNTAPAGVLMSLADGIGFEEAQALVEARPENGFTSVDQFLALDVFAGQGVSAEGLGVASQYFLLSATARLDRLRVPILSVVQRGQTGRGMVLQRTEGIL